MSGIEIAILVVYLLGVLLYAVLDVARRAPADNLDATLFAVFGVLAGALWPVMLPFVVIGALGTALDRRLSK